MAWPAEPSSEATEEKATWLPSAAPPRHARATPRALAPEDLQSGLVVTVCDEANEALDTPGIERLHWSIPDPVAAGSGRAFEETFEELVERVSTLHTASGDRRSA